MVDYQLVGADQLDLFTWGELECEGVVDCLLLLEFLFDLFWLPTSRCASPLPELTDRFGLITIDNLHFLNRLIPSRIALPLTLSGRRIRRRVLILNFIHILLLKVEYHVGVIECKIQDFDDFVAEVGEGVQDIFF